MYELLPIWIVVFVFWTALYMLELTVVQTLIFLFRISLYVRDFFKILTPLLAGCHDESLRDILNELFNDIAIAICRTIRVLLKLPV